MREKFDAELNKIKTVSKAKSYRLLDDCATAFISAYADKKHLDESLLYVKLTRKYLTSKGFTVAEIDDYLLEQSYISKTRINKLRSDSLYMPDSLTVTPHIENKVDRHNTRTTTDLIIDKLQSNKDLIIALKNGISKQSLQYKFKISNSQLLINFYNQHRDIIE